MDAISLVPTVDTILVKAAHAVTVEDPAIAKILISAIHTAIVILSIIILALVLAAHIRETDTHLEGFTHILFRTTLKSTRKSQGPATTVAKL